MSLHKLPLQILFEKQSLEEITAGPALGTYAGMAGGYGYGRHKFASELQQYIKEEGLDPSVPEDMAKIKKASRRLAIQYKIPFAIGGMLVGQIIGGFLKGANRGVKVAVKAQRLATRGR